MYLQVVVEATQKSYLENNMVQDWLSVFKATVSTFQARRQREGFGRVWRRENKVFPWSGVKLKIAVKSISLPTPLSQGVQLHIMERVKKVKYNS